MPPRRSSKPTKEDAPLLTAAKPTPPVAPPVVVATAEPPKFLEYTPPTSLEKWNAERFDLLAVEFQLQPLPDWPATMTRFHGFAETDTQRWFYIRRLFGVMTLIPGGDAHPDDRKVWTREELCAQMSLEPSHLAEELLHLRVAWNEWSQQQQREEFLPVAPMTASEERRGELALGDELLRRYDFDPSLFEVEAYDERVVGDKTEQTMRSGEKNRAEKEWFIGKLMRPEWQKMLDEPMAGMMARAALVNELYLKRFDSEMMKLMPNTRKWKELSTARQQIEERYEDQLETLSEKFPELGVAGRVSFRSVISDLNLAHRQYYGRKDRRLWDKIHTAAEIQFLLRTSAQLPMPRYRLGWQVAMCEAIHGLYDPNFRSQLKRSELKRLDRGIRTTYEQMKNEAPEPEVDLERGVVPGDPGTDEFPDYGPDEKKKAEAE